MRSILEVGSEQLLIWEFYHEFNYHEICGTILCRKKTAQLTSWQNIPAMLGTSCYILADTFFISAAEGSDGITALNLVLPLYSLIFAIGSMIGTGSATRYAIAKASGSKTCDVYFSNAIFFAVAASIIFILGGVFCPETIIRIMGADDQIAAVGTSYTRIFLVFAPCFMLNYVFTSFVRNDADPTLAMAATLTSSFSKISLGLSVYVSASDWACQARHLPPDFLPSSEYFHLRGTLFYEEKHSALYTDTPIWPQAVSFVPAWDLGIHRRDVFRYYNHGI